MRFLAIWPQIGQALNLAAKLARKVLSFQRQFALLVLLLLPFGLSACAINQAPSYQAPEELAPYTIKALPLATPIWSSDGYELLIGFEIRSQEKPVFRHLVQEIEHATTYQFIDGQSLTNRVTLVEAFELEITKSEDGWLATLPKEQRDRHFESGFLQVADDVMKVEVLRSVRAYTALVEGADFTKLGFAHIPRNQDGSFFTLVPANFNRVYQDNHRTKGEIAWSDREARKCDYSVRYAWSRHADLEPDAALYVKLDRHSREVSAGELAEKSP